MGRLLFILAAPLLLASCLLTPGKFVSSLDIRADRSFTFTYQGEATLADADFQPTPTDEGGENAAKPETSDDRAKKQAVAETLAREVGYRSVEYLGANKFRIDYSLTGKLDRSFVFPPFNADGAAIFPWLVVEVRKDGTARMQAPGFGEESMNGVPGATPPGGDDGMKDRQGTFTFTTDAQLLMQNNEQGTAPGPGTKVVWTITPTTKSAPTAVVRFAN